MSEYFCIAISAAAMARLKHYVDMRAAKPLQHLDDAVHSIHMGTEWEAELRLSDLRALVSRSEGLPQLPNVKTLVENANARTAAVTALEEDDLSSRDAIQVARSDRDRALIALGRAVLAALGRA